LGDLGGVKEMGKGLVSVEVKCGSKGKRKAF